ncbi:recombinase family protein [Qipengyuania marisflavi]|uniref:Recombinase family protein n=1 Tax=Qipengyuania marisflavi TaxID=2486356 RepID=A0A5S3P0Q5_9SPHN|nr:recombinase family protein [Qipengyuania marisflavi]TMM46111.1 recombinase family protein [Qipengyuania marisflavi]
MSIVGYARVSSNSQNLDLQLQLLADAGCEKVFSEKMTGTSRSDRQALAECLDWVREGDTLVVTRLDRLARSGRDLHDIIAQLSSKQVGFRCLQQGAVDTTTSMGKLILGILGAVAEFETDIRKERQREGIERAKSAGVYKERKPTVNVEQVRSLREQEFGATDIATKLGIARASVYRALKDDPLTIAS